MWMHCVSITCSIVCSAVKQLLDLARRVCIYLVYKTEVYAKMSLSCYFYHATKFLACSLGGD